MIYMTHPEHGAMHVYSAHEAAAAEKLGWVQARQPTAAEIVAMKTGEPIKRGPGRPKKVLDEDEG